MKVLHVHLGNVPIPPPRYGGTERVIWSLATAQAEAGHDVRLLVKNAAECRLPTITRDPTKALETQVGEWPDIVHFHRPPESEPDRPYVCTEHGNGQHPRQYPINTIFLSANHARRHNAECFVHNGLNWAEYGDPEYHPSKRYALFLGKARAATKNLVGCIDIAARARMPLRVLGGWRFSPKRRPPLCLDWQVRFHGMVGGERKLALIRGGSALIAPVRWHEPFGLMVIEALYLGVPVLATPYGALPELITDDSIGTLSIDYRQLADAAASTGQYDRKACHETAVTRFSAQRMARDYMEQYEKVLAGQPLNSARPQAGPTSGELLPVNSVAGDH